VHASTAPSAEKEPAAHGTQAPVVSVEFAKYPAGHVAAQASAPGAE